MTLRDCAKTVLKAARIGRVRAFAGLRGIRAVRSRLHLPRNQALSPHHPDATAAGINALPVDPAQTVTRPLPAMPGEREVAPIFRRAERVTFPATFVTEIIDARFWGFYGGSVFARDGRLVPELSKDVWGPRLHTAFLRARLPVPRHLPGRTLSLVTPEASANYHHWTVDLLPRAGLARRAGYDLGGFDHILIKMRGLPFQLEGLRRLGIDPDSDRLIRVRDDDHFRCDALVVPSVRDDVSLVGPGDMDFVRALFLPDPPPAASRRRLYVTRRDAAFRRVLNEHQVLLLLREHGFEEITLSGLTVAAQARVFSEAEAVAGPNSSGLANLLFASPGCRVIEFFAPGWVVPYNWMICARFGFPHTALVGDGPRPDPGALPRGVREDITLDLALLRAALATLPSGNQ
ncbi:glycosyltransferase family 61 protein [Termitidicoccus mucosus]|uniref:Glycosyltransferase 61 catalytic domain-containing protein n=1 Tax=Termitidicoccus mucosus TaxID=1184151 RepID=A0A178IN15_9BACT|nr:hypothetical protein AW736_03840 [Opitutaceae bacterium TSB47]